ncbi:hypothetical protein MKX03_034036 [Papaver bracteatum]|nr:hypothetical protein MKX03_034036 [Papaver bracteatum]
MSALFLHSLISNHKVKPMDRLFVIIKKDGEGDIVDCESRLELLMVSSPDREDLVFSKGGWEDDEYIGEAACRAALEEAGVRGILDVSSSSCL